MLYNRATTELYVRASSVQINNRLGSAPDITFYEQFATSDGVALDGLRSSCALTMDDPTESFELVHPETGAALGSMSYAELQVALYSLYLKAATERDEREAPVVEEGPEEQTYVINEELDNGPTD